MGVDTYLVVGGGGGVNEWRLVQEAFLYRPGNGTELMHMIPSGSYEAGKCGLAMCL